MIGFFPDFYPDELLYSACARFAGRVKFPNKQMVMRDLFGKRGFSAIVDFPTRLEYFLSMIPHHNYSVDDLINNHTLFPFYEPFLLADRAGIIRKEMKSFNDNHLRTRLAMNISQVNLPDYLRFCPYCAAYDRKEYGETYWHRIHQLAGVLVCPSHQCFLQNSPIRWERESSYLFHEAENCLNSSEVSSVACINDSKFSDCVYLKIAKEAQWLLARHGLSFKPGELRKRYYNVLLQKGYAFYNGKIRSGELLKSFSSFFEPQIFEELGCKLKITGNSWLARLVDKTYSEVFYHPLRHLLLLQFLQTDVKKMFGSFIEFKPFGDPPYPCLNKIAPHYKELIIKNCQVFDNTAKKDKRRRPVAIFSCACGFSYQRAGPDETEESKFQYDLVRNYGDLWENELQKHWSNLELSSSEIGRRFGTTVGLVTRHAIRLNLPMNTGETRNLSGYDRHRNPQNYFSEALQEKRTKWLEVLKKFPKINRAELISKANTLYLWLQKHDAEWFEEHLPKSKKISNKKERLNWKKIDAKLFAVVKKVCGEILKLQEKPVRVSITEIIRRIGCKSWLEKRDKKLPLTAKFLCNALETLEGFMLRKLKLMEARFIKRRKVPSRQVLIRTAVINNTTTQNSSGIQKAIDESLRKIKIAVMSRQCSI